MAQVELFRFEVDDAVAGFVRQGTAEAAAGRSLQNSRSVVVNEAAKKTRIFFSLTRLGAAMHKAGAVRAQSLRRVVVQHR